MPLAMADSCKQWNTLKAASQRSPSVISTHGEPNSRAKSALAGLIFTASATEPSRSSLFPLNFVHIGYGKMKRIRYNFLK